ncbi:MAG: hypothetical protein KF747_20260 [Nitrospira sp.]|nr:hypothetical protein [Nitrospira sp.]
MDLLNRLKACVPDERDIPVLLAAAVGGQQRLLKSGVIEYLTGGPKYSIFARVRYKNGQIDRFQPGTVLLSPKAQDKFIAQVSNDAAQTHGSFVSRRALFSEVPLRGCFQWRERFRISPCPKTARIGSGLDWFAFASSQLTRKNFSHLGPPFPFVMEVRTFRSPNRFLEESRALRDLDTHQYLLTLLLHGRFRYAQHDFERRWTYVMRRKRIEYHLLHQGFDSGLDGRAEGFARRRMCSAPIYKGPDYYNHLWGGDDQLHMPDTIVSDLMLYDALPRDLLRRFNRACYWYSLGVQFNKESALSTIAFANAVECLLPRPSKSQCSSCGKPSGPGPTKLFTQHLKKYGVLPPSLAWRRDSIYGVRSALVHGSHAKRTDEDLFGSVDPSVDSLLTEIVTQRSLLGWLRDTRRPT